MVFANQVTYNPWYWRMTITVHMVNSALKFTYNKLAVTIIINHLLMDYCLVQLVTHQFLTLLAYYYLVTSPYVYIGY